MTQQQKIAAALLKAGPSNTPSWYDSDFTDSESGSSVQVITTPSTTSACDEGAGGTDPHRGAPAQPGWKINLMLAVSAALTILSLFFFFKSLR